MLPGFLDIGTLLIIIHIFGIAAGAGGAFVSDAMFFLSVQDRIFTKVELTFMRLGSRMVWAGLTVLILSGIGLFSLAPEAYLSSSKFLAKITIVVIIIVNGIVFHLSHIPRFHRHAERHFPSSEEFVRHSGLLMASGAISVTSWGSAIILGALRGVPYSYVTIMLAYTVVLSIAVAIALLVRKRVLGLS